MTFLPLLSIKSLLPVQQAHITTTPPCGHQRCKRTAVSVSRNRQMWSKKPESARHERYGVGTEGQRSGSGAVVMGGLAVMRWNEGDTPMSGRRTGRA